MAEEKKNEEVVAETVEKAVSEPIVETAEKDVTESVEETVVKSVEETVAETAAEGVKEKSNISPGVARAVANAFRARTDNTDKVMGGAIPFPPQIPINNMNMLGSVFPTGAVNLQNAVKVVFASGGTGGHLYPALALADELKNFGILSCFFDSYKGMAHEIVERLGYPVTPVFAKGLEGSWWDKIMAILETGCGFIQCLYYLNFLHPAVVVGSGSYVCAPVVLAAAVLGIPVVLLEQNAFAGKAVRWLSHLAKCVCVSTPGEYPGIAPEKIIVTGNPVNSVITRISSLKARERLGIPKDRPCVVVAGGSQGAASINRAVLASLPKWVDRDMTVIHITGPKHLEEVFVRSQELVRGKAIDYRPIAYTDEMPALYAVADLIVCRAGATTLSEITVRGLPSILVPYPHAAENHQEANARILEERGAAKIIADEQIEAQLAESVFSIIDNNELKNKMAAASRSLGHPEALSKVLAVIMASMKR
ncbi:undecaprenyldiphospho-muramoylpentapeptide beta-N-acetylglucosaminyltransferase [bacterium]|nr:undecaprenyldiphospho-muramoylpentapeptide beta-N-acetylglucosaminyltransferase [bacterium]